jgi:hypothetical protein
MSHPILELQEDCINYSGNATNILRKAYAYSRKLHLTDFSNWLDLEMKGYDKPSNVPEYRRVNGTIQAQSYGRLIPVQLPSDVLDMLSSIGITQPISELSTIIGSHESGTVHMPFQGDLNAELCKAVDVETQFYLVVGKGQLKSIIDSVIDSILKWTLLFEEEGILGKELTFSEEDANKAKAISPEKYNPLIINGNVDTVMIQNDTINSTQHAMKED